VVIDYVNVLAGYESFGWGVFGREVVRADCYIMRPAFFSVTAGFLVLFYFHFFEYKKRFYY
jgi:hypothetical protein